MNLSIYCGSYRVRSDIYKRRVLCVLCFCEFKERVELLLKVAKQFVNSASQR